MSTDIYGAGIKDIRIAAEATESYDARQQEKLLQAEREKNQLLEKSVQMKDEFLTIISHEFKTPLTVINSAIQAIESLCRYEMSPKLQGFIKKIKQNSFRQLRLVNNLLDITRINAGYVNVHKKNMDIVLLTKSIVYSVYLYASRKGVTLSFKTSFKKKIIGIDDEKYERILLNLLSNAIKFTSEGNSITVSLGRSKGNICIKVKDTGVGIPKDKIGLIFEKFGQVDNSLTRQAEGSGIGLSLAKLFAEALGGGISVKSKVGEGSTFTVLIPDSSVQEDQPKDMNKDLSDTRLIQATAIEFSDIYLE